MTRRGRQKRGKPQQVPNRSHNDEQDLSTRLVRQFAAVSTQSQRPPNWLDLPAELLENIFRFLDNKTLLLAQGVAKQWKCVIQGEFPSLQRKLFFRLGPLPPGSLALARLANSAINPLLTCGIRIGQFRLSSLGFRYDSFVRNFVRSVHIVVDRPCARLDFDSPEQKSLMKMFFVQRGFWTQVYVHEKDGRVLTDMGQGMNEFCRDLTVSQVLEQVSYIVGCGKTVEYV